jgi:hypothetical protein
VKTVLLVLGFGVAVSLFCFSGCTRIETPVRDKPADPGAPGAGPPGDNPVGPLVILPETIRILDTEPVTLEARGGSGTVLWGSEPPFDGLFSPETGRSVLLTPPDLPSSTTITVTASDQNRVTARVEAVITDQGGPPRAGELLINELAWAGTLTSTNDEYVELVNTGERPLYLKDWSIDNAEGAGKPLVFSGRVEGSSVFLIANYPPESGMSAIRARVDWADSGLSLSNSVFGPFVLRNGEGLEFDRAGDGGRYRLGINRSGARASVARFSGSRTTAWDEASWYTEGLSSNLGDGTLGTPGAANSGTPYSEGTSPGDPPGPADNGGDARALISCFFVDARDEIGEDWVELFITAAGNVKNFMVTDLDGTDSSISGGIDAFVKEGERILIVWGKAPGSSGGVFFVRDQGPTATRDELVLFCGAECLDGLCYSTDGKLPDDYARLVVPSGDGGFGWEGDPIRSAYGTRLPDQGGGCVEGRGSVFWSTDAPPVPGTPVPGSVAPRIDAP